MTCTSPQNEGEYLQLANDLKDQYEVINQQRKSLKRKADALESENKKLKEDVRRFNIFWNDKKEVMNAVTHNGWVLNYASVEFKGDKEVVLAAVNQWGYALQYASMELRKDKEVVLVAVTQDGDALQYASEHLKGYKEVVKAAVTQCGWSVLRFASEQLKKEIRDLCYVEE